MFESRAARRCAGVLAAVLATGLAGASTASADFSIARCTGEGIFARGASFQTSAFTGFSTAFVSATAPGCGGTAPLVTFQASGSGAGRQALGVKNATTNPFQDRDVSVRFAASDEPPTATERQQIEKGPIDANGADVTAADDSPLHVIPVAIGAVAVMVHLPTGCDYTAAANKPLDSRPAIDNATLEAVFAGAASADTWGEVIPGVDATCAAKPVVRVVRQDSSGTSFALKQLLARINPARGWAALANQNWPDLAGHPVYRSTDSGGGALRGVLATSASSQRDNGTLTAATIDFATTGGIGYADLATARGGTNQPFLWADATTDTTFWLSLQRGTAADPKADATYDDPQANVNGYKTSVSNAAGGPRGAACNAVTPRNVPATPAADPTLGEWAAVDSTASGQGYAACTLTYQLAFDDNAVVYCNSASEERKARTVKDWLTLVTDTAGQNTLPGQDYDVLPANVLTIAKNGAAAIGWKKNGSSGRPCQATTPPPADPVATPTPVGQQQVQNPPPPAPVSNAITITSARAVGASIRLALQCPSLGKLSITSSAKPKKGKTVKLATKTFTVSKAGAQTVTLSLSSAAKKALKKSKSLKFTVKVTYSPTGGAAKTITKTVTVKQPKS